MRLATTILTGLAVVLAFGASYYATVYWLTEDYQEFIRIWPFVGWWLVTASIIGVIQAVSRQSVDRRK